VKPVRCIRMSRCKEFYDKWEKDGSDWCEKASSSVSEINAYLDIITLFEKEGLSRDFIFKNFKESAARPIYRSYNEDVRAKAIDIVKERLKKQQKITTTETHSLMKLLNKDCDLQKEGCCEICKKAFTNYHPPQRDHDHITGANRGILCRNCNVAIGHFKDDIKLLEGAIDYLKKYRCC
jgi:hypothetical protein